MHFHARCSINTRDFFLLLVLITTLSILLNLQLSFYDYLPPDKAHLTDTLRGFEDRPLAYSGYNFPQQKLLPVQDVVRTYAETEGKYIYREGQGVFEDGRPFRRSLSQHDNADGVKDSGAIDENIRTRLNKIQKQLQMAAVKHISVITGYSSRTPNVVGNLSGQRQVFVYRNMGLSWLDGKTLVQGNWSVLLCEDCNSSCHNACIETSQQVLQISTPASDVGRRTELLCTIANTNLNLQGFLDEKPICTHIKGNCLSLPKHNEKRVYIQYKAGRCFLWHLPKQPMHILGGYILRSQILVSGYQPHRVYVHQNIIVGSYESTSFTISNPSKHSVDEVLQAVSENYGLGSVSKWWSRFQATIGHGLRQILLELRKAHLNVSRCERFYQLFVVDVICVTLQSCFISQVSDTSSSSNSFENVVSFLLSENIEVEEMANALEDMELSTKLQHEDLIYLLDWRREKTFLNEWISLIETMSITTQDGELSRDMHRHVVMAKLESYFSSSEGSEQEPQYSAEIPSVIDESGTPSTGKSNMNCSQDVSSCGAIDSILVTPDFPVHNISNKTFEVHVQYETVIIRLKVNARGCQCQSRLDSMYNAPGARNITLALGETVVRVYLMNTDETVASTATITFHRRGRLDHGFLNETDLCGFKQDCDLLYAPNERCGYIKTSTANILPPCRAGDNPGHWVVPCTDCKTGEGCTWSRATWQPVGCSYQQFSRRRLQQCLRGRKLLFIGDSTNRGIANYIIEQTNDTLHDWDKTHTTRLYQNVNNNRTQVAFSYYPHFWLPVTHRPSFKKVLYQLFKRSLPLENNTNTVLVVGGVQWISKQHIDLIAEALQRKGLSGIKTVIKGLGAGFHLPVESMRYVPPQSYPELYRREAEVLAYAMQHGFHVAATFSMTASRHRDFLEGQCACHFHRVRKIVAAGATHGRYIVEGEVNTAYSQIILNQIC